MTTVAHVDDCRSFVGTAELNVGIFDFFAPTLGALLVCCAFRSDVVTFEGLDLGLQFLSQERREVRRFRFRDDCFRAGICEVQGMRHQYLSPILCVKLSRLHKPWFSAPQHSQRKTFRAVPFVAGSRFPQSPQNTNDPIAVIVSLLEANIINIVVVRERAMAGQRCEDPMTFFFLAIVAKPGALL